MYVTVAELHLAEGTATLTDEGLLLDGFVERDPEVIAFLNTTDELEAGVHRCLEMGARVLKLAGASLDTQLVEHRFAEMTDSLERSVGELASKVDASARGLLDEENGELSGALKSWLADVNELLGATFDESSKRSVIAKLETVLEKARTEQVTSVRSLLDPDNGESPLARWRAEIVREVRDRGQAIETVLQELTTKLRLEDQKDDLMALTAIKGFDYEDIVFEVLQQIVAPLQDVPARVGNEAGSTGGKVGDMVVDIDPSSARGRSPRYVVECKDRAMPLKKALDELDKAIANRDADAGLIVFSSGDVSPAADVFQWFRNRAIVVLDRESLDATPLRLACLWARWVSCRETSDDPSSLDPERIAGLVDAGLKSLKTASAIRGSHTRAKKAVDEAGRHLDVLIGEAEATLGELAACVGGSQG
jgi:hypothetical protein